MNKIVKLFVYLNFLFSFSVFSLNTKLPLYNFLDKLQNIVGQDSGYNKIDEINNLLKSIDNSFQEKTGFSNIKIQQKFYDICNYFDDNQNIKPRHLRYLKKQLIDFDSFVKDFLEKNKSYIAKENLVFINKIIRFNSLLLSLVSIDDLYKFDTWNNVLDFCLYRPWEVISKNKKVFVPVCSIATATICYFLFSSHFKEMFNKFSLKRRYLIEHFDSLRQPNLKDSGYYAARLAIIMLSTDNKNVLQKKLKEWGNWDEWLVIWQNYLFDVNKEGWIDEFEIKRLFSVDGHNLLGTAEEIISLDKDPINFKNIDFDNVVVVDDVESVYKQHGISSFIPNIYKLRKEGIPQVVILNVAKMEGASLSNGNHWIAIKISKNNYIKKGYSVCAADSLGSDHSNDLGVKKISNLFIDQIVPEENMLEIGKEIDSAFNIWKQNANLDVMLTYFNSAVRYANIGDDKGSFWNRDSFVNYKKRINDIFNNIKKYSTNIDLEPRIEVDFIAESENLNDYIKRLCGYIEE